MYDSNANLVVTCDGCGYCAGRLWKQSFDRTELNEKFEVWNWFPVTPDDCTRHYCPSCMKGKLYRDALQVYQCRD